MNLLVDLLGQSPSKVEGTVILGPKSSQQQKWSINTPLNEEAIFKVYVLKDTGIYYPSDAKCSLILISIRTPMSTSLSSENHFNQAMKF